MFVRDWIGRIFNIFYPALDRLGGIHKLDIASISEAPNAFAVLRGWSMELLYRGDLHDDQKLLTTAYQAVKLCFYLDKRNTLEPIKRSPMLAFYKGLPLFQRANGNSSVCFVSELFSCISAVDGFTVARGVASVK